MHIKIIIIIFLMFAGTLFSGENKERKATESEEILKISNELSGNTTISEQRFQLLSEKLKKLMPDGGEILIEHAKAVRSGNVKEVEMLENFIIIEGYKSNLKSDATKEDLKHETVSLRDLWDMTEKSNELLSDYGVLNAEMSAVFFLLRLEKNTEKGRQEALALKPEDRDVIKKFLPPKLKDEYYKKSTTAIGKMKISEDIRQKLLKLSKSLFSKPVKKAD